VRYYWPSRDTWKIFVKYILLKFKSLQAVLRDQSDAWNDYVPNISRTPCLQAKQYSLFPTEDVNFID
jgi:hypothetical protein